MALHCDHLIAALLIVVAVMSACGDIFLTSSDSNDGIGMAEQQQLRHSLECLDIHRVA